MKILIAVPTFESIYPDTFKSIYGLDKGGHEVAFDFVRGYDCAAARNRIAELALNEGTDYVLMVDNDTVLPDDTLVKLLEDPKDVCLGVYPRRGDNNLYDGRAALLRLGERDYTYEFMYTADELSSLRDSGEYKIQVHGGGMGCALIKTEVFRRFPYPWFKWLTYDNKTSLSEDLYFCELCHSVNIPIYADIRVMCGHIMRHTQYME